MLRGPVFTDIESLNRSVTGSMVDLVHMAQNDIARGYTPLEVSQRINGSPMSYLNYESPDCEMKKLINEREWI